MVIETIDTSCVNCGLVGLGTAESFFAFHLKPSSDIYQCVEAALGLHNFRLPIPENMTDSFIKFLITIVIHDLNYGYW